MGMAEAFSRGRRRRRGREYSSSSSSSSGSRDTRSGRGRSRNRKSPVPPPLPPKRHSSATSDHGENSVSSKIVMASVDSNSVSRDLSLLKDSSVENDITVKPSTSAQYVNMTGVSVQRGQDPKVHPPPLSVRFCHKRMLKYKNLVELSALHLLINMTQLLNLHLLMRLLRGTPG